NTLTYTPTANNNGQYTFTYNVADGNGEPGSAIVTINVNPVNDAPTSAALTVTTTEDVSGIVITPITADVDSANVYVNQATQAAHGSVTRNVDRKSFTYVPSTNFYGSDSFSFTVDDGSAVSPSYTAAITITEVNDEPTFSPLVKEVLSTQTSFTINLDNYARDLETTSGLIYAVEDISKTGETNANKITYTTSGARSETLQFTLGTGIAANDNNVLKITVTDKGNSQGLDTKNPSFEFKVLVLAAQPQAVDDSANTNKNSAVTVDVLRNDVVAQTGDTLTLVPDGFQTTSNEGGRVELVAATSTTTAKLKYTPKTDFIGNDRFTYKIRDNNAVEKTATVSITVLDPSANLSEYEKKYNEYSDQLDVYDDDYYDFKDDYERADDRNNQDDLEDAEKDLEDLSDDLDKLLNRANDLVDDIEKADDSKYDNLEDDAKDLVDDIESVLDRIERLLNPTTETVDFYTDDVQTQPRTTSGSITINQLPPEVLANVGPINQPEETTTSPSPFSSSLVLLLVGILVVMAVIIFMVVILMKR
ncbi:tandem-95 repeat protein, partial [Candidatus Woesearchaeota archaeon]|nr:tandem-95 repeat protein [Candidatus Woesearchaeota archaeon]